MPVDYSSWYHNAKAELAKVYQEKAGLEQALADCDTRIEALTRTIAALAPLVGEKAPTSAPAVGMTDAIRAILAQAEGALSAGEIRERLEALGFDMASYSNPLATVHTILRRLTESEEISVQARKARKGVEPIFGKRFVIGKEMKGFIGIARIKRG
jgi:hypothetical protein